MFYAYQLWKEIEIEFNQKDFFQQYGLSGWIFRSRQNTQWYLLDLLDLLHPLSRIWVIYNQNPIMHNQWEWVIYNQRERVPKNFHPFLFSAPFYTIKDLSGVGVGVVVGVGVYHK